VPAITPILNITRLHSAVGLVGGLSRSFAIARSYATVRSITIPASDGRARIRRLLKDTPLHMSVLAKVGTTYNALAHLTFGAVALLGKSECGTADRDEETRLRLLTPAIKAFVSDKAVSAMEECMASLGGQGYMEENVIGRLIRDCTVDRIWEGTISVLSLDLIRASQGDRGITPFIKWANHVIASTPTLLRGGVQLDTCLNSLRSSLETVTEILSAPSISPFIPRPLLFLFAHTSAALYLLEHAIWAHHNRDTYASWETDADVFKRWVEEGLSVAREEVERVRAFDHGGERERRDLDLVYGSEGPRIKARL